MGNRLKVLGQSGEDSMCRGIVPGCLYGVSRVSKSSGERDHYQCNKHGDGFWYGISGYHFPVDARICAGGIYYSGVASPCSDRNAGLAFVVVWPATETLSA
nr:hypothetical protein CFP56_42084 [Quercus suber]